MTLLRKMGVMLLATALVGCGGIRPVSPPWDVLALRAHAASWERLLAAEDARAGSPEQLEVMRAGLDHDEPALRAMAVRGLGRLERADLAADIARLLGDRDAGVRASAANALAQAARGGVVVRSPLHVALRAEEDGRAAGVIGESIGRMPHADIDESRRTLALLVPRLAGADNGPEALGILRGLYFLARQQGARGAFDSVAAAAVRGYLTADSAAMVGEWSPAAERARVIASGADTAAVRIRVLAVATLAAAGAMDEATAVAALRDDAWTVRREAVASTATLPDSAAVRRLLMTALSDHSGEVRFEALRAYGRSQAATHGCDPVRDALADVHVHVRLHAVELLGACPDRSAADVLFLDSLSATMYGVDWHAGARATLALASADEERARARLLRDGLPADPFARIYATRTLGILGDTAALRRLAADRSFNVRTAAVQALSEIIGREGDHTYLRQLSVDDSQLLQAAAAALEGTRLPEATGALLDALDRVSAARAETSRDARRALLLRAGELGGPHHDARVRPYLRDFDPVISELAADILGRWTGSRPIPRPTPPPALPLPTFAEAAALAESTVEMEMSDGSRVVLRLLPFDAPTNAARFARLARDGYYDGLTLHRVVPNFVVQGGSPHANEYTGDGPFSRDELGLAGNWRGTVGLSTRGRDTGDAQLFINLIDNVRLDHEYTVFAEVIEGMDVVSRMLEGAQIRRMHLQPLTARDPVPPLTPGPRMPTPESRILAPTARIAHLR
jgi:cyclophilin family peptidyl-prolyl cis-trans isomerase/HEAT repeat protein